MKVSEHPNWIQGKINSDLTKKNKREKLVEIYLENPKFCKHCNSIIPYKDRFVKIFCNSSCSAKFNNPKKVINSTGTKSLLCPKCNLEFETSKYSGPTTFCISCRHEREKILKQSNVVNKPKRKRTTRRKRLPDNNIKFEKYSLNPNYCVVCGLSISFDQRHRVTCSEECLSKKRSLRAKSNPLLGGNKNRFSVWYTSPTAGRVFLESSYELKVAKELDNNFIRWNRPKFLFYSIEGKIKRYFPDFYLIDFDFYLDPKNSYLIVQDQKKIKRVIEDNKIRLLVLTKEELEWTNIYNRIRVFNQYENNYN